MDRIQRGIATRIQHWIDAVEGGNVLSNSDIRWLVGKEGLADYQAEVSDARVERDSRRKTFVEINDGNVPDYLAAVDRAKAAVAQQLKDGDKFKSKAKIGTVKHRDAEKAWRDRRTTCLALQEQVGEYWEAVDEKYHEAFHVPPEGGWGDKGAIIAELQWPPHLIKTQLEHRPEAHLVNVPLHQQRDLLLRELAKLERPDPVLPTMTILARAQRLREAAEQ